VNFKILLFFFFIISTVTSSHSQNSLVISGGEATGTGGIVSYSIGQLVYSVYSDNDFTITEGVQQPYEISIETDIATPLIDTVKLHVYPNPASGYITLEKMDLQPHSYSYRLTGPDGKVLNEGVVRDKKTVLWILDFPPGIYILSVYRGAYETQSFTIIKK
jgi:hypothetical protein